jgi:pyruvate dehydrogenase (quinone)
MEGEPKFEESQVLPDFPFARYAELLGFKGIRIDSPEGVGRAWDEAFASDRPVVIEAWVSADVPTVPPTMRKEQAENLAKALASGDPDAESVRVQLDLQEIEEEANVGKTGVY